MNKDSKKLINILMLLVMLAIGIGSGYAVAEINNAIVKDESRKIDTAAFGSATAAVMVIAYAWMMLSAFVLNKIKKT